MEKEIISKPPDFLPKRFVPYEPAYRIGIPSEGGIYAFKDMRGVLYVGQTSCLWRRYGEHQDPDNPRLHDAHRHRVGQLEFGWRLVPVEERDKAERELIRYFQPPCNHITYSQH